MMHEKPQLGRASNPGLAVTDCRSSQHGRLFVDRQWLIRSASWESSFGPRSAVPAALSSAACGMAR